MGNFQFDCCQSVESIHRVPDKSTLTQSKSSNITLPPKTYNSLRTLCGQVHELPYSQYGDNREGTLSFLITYFALVNFYHVLKDHDPLQHQSQLSHNVKAVYGLNCVCFALHSMRVGSWLASGS